MNTRKPTKKEVPDNADCWYWFDNRQGWIRRDGGTTRFWWQRGDRWLPYDAIPDPTNQPTKRSKP